jgi:hypothetical protein
VHKREVRHSVREAFVQSSNIEYPGGGSGIKALWWNPERAICSLTEWDAGYAVRLVERAVAKMRGDGLTISSMKSIVNVCKSLAAEDKSRGSEGVVSTRGPEGAQAVFDSLDRRIEATGIDPKRLDQSPTMEEYLRNHT